MPSIGSIQGRKTAPKPLLWAFALLALIGFLLFFFPAYVIRPFSHQDPSLLAWAMRLRQIAPVWAPVCALAAGLLAVMVWRRLRRWQMALVSVATVLVLGSAILSHLNYFEWMFHHLGTPGFDAVLASKLDGSEMVMGVRIGNDARAYPIREMAYHHLVNDVVGTVPIVVTY